MKHQTIAMLVHSFEPGGAEVLACRLAISLRHRYNFVVIGLDGSGPLQGELQCNGITTIKLSRRPGYDFALVKDLYAALRHHNCNLIHAHQYTPFLYGLLARSFGHDIPILFTEHGRFFPDRRRIRRIFANRILLGKQDRITAVCETVRLALVNYEGLACSRIVVIPNGVDTSYFAPADSIAKRQARECLGLPENAFVISMVARLDPIKDHNTAIRAFKNLSKQISCVRLLLVGDGPLHNPTARYLEEQQLTSNVLLCGQKSEVRLYYHAADCLLLTSLSEGMPLTVIEAMSCGLPVVATTCGALPELVEHGKTGFLAPVGDEGLITHHLVRLGRDDSLRSQMGHAARHKCVSLYDWRMTVQRYATFYEEMTGIREGISQHDYIPVFCG